LSGYTISMSGPDVTEAEIEAVEAVLRTPHLSLGPRIAEFEKRFAAYACPEPGRRVGARHAVGVSSGTAGLHLCVIAAGVSEGDLVITTPFSFVSSANVILYERAIPIFVDIAPHTLNIDPALVAQAADDLARGGDAANRWLPPALRDHPSSTFHSPSSNLHPPPSNLHPPSSILPVHAFGQPADMDSLLDVAREYGLEVIEDACEALGAEYKNRRIGTQYAIRNTQPSSPFIPTNKSPPAKAA